MWSFRGSSRPKRLVEKWSAVISIWIANESTTPFKVIAVTAKREISLIAFKYEKYAKMLSNYSNDVWCRFINRALIRRSFRHQVDHKMITSAGYHPVVTFNKLPHYYDSVAFITYFLSSHIYTAPTEMSTTCRALFTFPDNECVSWKVICHLHDCERLVSGWGFLRLDNFMNLDGQIEFGGNLSGR